MPTIMMVGGEFNTPADWVRIGNAVAIADNFAAAHGGNAPVLVFVDAGGTFNNDTECVNGGRGNSADHLTKDVVPFMISKFGVSAHRENWGVVGFSMGGTCAVDLAVMHPDMFSAFEDIAGDIAPNSGTKDETICTAVRRQCRGICVVRSHQRHHAPRRLQRCRRLVRHQQRSVPGAEFGRELAVRAWATRTGSPVPSSLHPVCTTGPSHRRPSRPRCPGWPVNSARQGHHRRRCPHHRHRRRSFRWPRSSG